jgi:TetR/AcrR family tetracycline transcriptional repressor
VVADQAIALADTEGLDAVTIRRLAGDLGVTPMALYWHFRTKDELLAGAADRVLDGLILPANKSESWPDELRALMVELVRVLSAHPQLVELIAQRMLAGAPGLEMTERALAALDEAGFPQDEAARLAGHAMRTAMALATGDLVDDSGMSSEEREGHLRQKRSMLSALPSEKYPMLVGCADFMTYCADPIEFYTLGVEHFVAGVEGLAARRPVSSR